jgi:ketosteroid isomerase-like protein
MSRENVELLQAVAAEVAEGDAMAWLRLMTDDVRVFPRPEEPGVKEVYEGLDELMEYALNWYAQWEDYELVPVRFFDAGDQVLVVMLEHGRMARDGIRIEQEFSHSFTMRDGRIVEWRMYDSHEQALEALGLSA